MEKLTYSVRELAEALGIGISAAYKLTNIEGFPVVQIGARKIKRPLKIGLQILRTQQG